MPQDLPTDEAAETVARRLRVKISFMALGGDYEQTQERAQLVPFPSLLSPPFRDSHWLQTFRPQAPSGTAGSLIATLSNSRILGTGPAPQTLQEAFEGNRPSG